MTHHDELGDTPFDLLGQRGVEGCSCPGAVGEQRPPPSLPVLTTTLESLSDKEKSWVEFWYFMAGVMATRSKDPRTKVGAVIVGLNRHHTALGYNGFPPGIEDREDRLNDRAVKYHFIQHAERAVIDNAQFDLEGSTIFVTMYPCSECAKSIVVKRVSRLVCPPPPKDEPWATSAKFATEMLQEAGIEVILMGGEAKPHAA